MENQIQELIKQINEKNLSRSLERNDKNIDEANRTLEMSVSSEVPYERWFGFEILDHSSSSIRMDRLNNKASLRDTHYGDTIGVIEKAWIDGGERKLRVGAKFSKNSDRAETIFKDIMDGIRSNVSIRYVVHQMVMEKEVDGVQYYRVTDWEPIHVSIEDDPADYSVGVGRGLTKEEIEFQASKLGLQIVAKSSENNNKKERFKVSEEKKQSLDEQNSAIQIKVKEAVEDRNVVIASINSMANNMKDQLKGVNLQVEANKFIKEGKSDRDFWNFIEGKLQDPASRNTPEDFLDMSKKEVKQYSFKNAALYQVGLLSRDKVGFELEASKAVADKLNAIPKGIFIPQDVMTMKRDMSVGLASNYGSDLVGTDHMGSQLIDLLRNKMLLTRLGAKTLSGLVGNVSIPKWASSATAGWSATEGAGTTESTPGTSVLSLSPKEVSANVDYTRQLLLQSDPSVDALIKDDLVKSLAIKIDLAGYHGSNSNGQPQGIVGTSGVGSVALASATNAKFIEFESDVDAANALDGTFNFVTTPSIRGTLKARAKESGHPVYICSENSIVNGYPMWTSNQISSGYVIFGDFSQVIIAEWGGLDLYAVIAARTGIVTLTAFKTIDIGVRQPGAFSIGTSFS